jgi:hypothetical protein
MKAQSFQEIAVRVALEQAIAKKSDEYAGQAKGIADQLSRANLDNTQIRGLETLACTTDKVSDITDWLKLRVGRDSKRERWAREGVGRDLLSMLEGLRSDARQICAALRETYPLDDDQERRLHLRLCREYLKHLAAHFEYMKGSQ